MEKQYGQWVPEAERAEWLERVKAEVLEGLYSKNPRVVNSMKQAIAQGLVPPPEVLPVRKGKL